MRDNLYTSHYDLLTALRATDFQAFNRAGQRAAEMNTGRLEQGLSEILAFVLNSVPSQWGGVAGWRLDSDG